MAAARSSRDVITKSPMSVSGFTQRYMRWTHTSSSVATAIAILPRLAFYILLITVILAWNVVAWVLFFWFTLPWRAFRNSSRREKRRQLEHEEIIAAMRGQVR